MAPDQFSSTFEIHELASGSFIKITSDCSFFLFMNGNRAVSTCFFISRLTSITLSFLLLNAAFTFSKLGSSATQGWHQVAQKLMTYVVSFSILSNGSNALKS